MTPLFNIADYELIYIQLAVYAFAMLTRLAALSLVRPFSRSGRRNELLRIGSDYSLIGVGVFVAASTNEASYFAHKVAPLFKNAELWMLAILFLLYLLSYSIFLHLQDRDLSGLGNKIYVGILLTLSVLVGLIGLGGAGILAAAATT